MSKLLDLTGKRFGKLVVTERHSKISGEKPKWVCLCSCGNTVIVSGFNLKKENGTRSCGCLRGTHRMSNERIYSIWVDMKKRCKEDVANYGCRGIGFSNDWNTFEGFIADMGESYFEGGSLERIDVNGNYCKENCTWIEPKQQARNKRMYTTNSVGSPCVTRYVNKGVISLRARVQNPNTGKRVSKSLSLSKYSEEEALEILADWVKSKHKLFGYGESHGS